MFQALSVPALTPDLPLTKMTTASAARRPQASSPSKSKKPGVSIILILFPFHSPLEIAVEIADAFVDKGEIVYTLNKDGDKRDYMATENKTEVEMVILTNGGTASASEVLVGALRDYNLATIVGEKTFGKGVTQIPYEFWDGSIMKITDSRYYTPSGICIDKEGIEPDVEVKMSAEKAARISELSLDEDEQLKAAIEILDRD